MRSPLAILISAALPAVFAAEMVFPGPEWEEVAPKTAGLDSAKLTEAIRHLEANTGRDGARELVVVRNGRMVWRGDNVDRVHGIWSCTKSFTSTILGLLIEDGKCTLESKAASILPEMQEHYPAVTLRHFSTMTSGYRAEGDDTSGSYTHGPSSTPFNPAIQSLFPPGAAYAYWDSAMNQFANALTRIAGEPLDGLLKRRIADPIGMNPATWKWGDFGSVDGTRVNGGAGNGNKHIQISARELARLGHLFLNYGRWNNRQLISSNWVHEATAVQVAAGLSNAWPRSGIAGPGFYGYNWWRNANGPDGKMLWPGAPDDTFGASGHNNNKLFVIPSWGMVIVRLGLDQADRKWTDEAQGEFLRLVGTAIQRAYETNRGALPKPADLPKQTSLPDPLVMLDGQKVANREMWLQERRPELLRLFQHYMYGEIPPKPGQSFGRVERTDAAAFGGKATLCEVTLGFDEPRAEPIHLMLIVPNKRSKAAPVVLGINYFGNHTLVRDKKVRLSDKWMPERGAGVVANRATEASRGTWADIWRIEELIDRGYALATFYNGDVDPDTPDQRGLQKHFPQADPADDCGSIAAWAWGLQRAVDYLVTAPGIDARRIIVTGHSRMGKAALLAAAFDERIALAIPHQAGCGGSAPSRARIAVGKSYNTLDTVKTKPPETVADINDKFPHWFNSRFKEFNTQPERLPFDQNCLVALCAPRPVLFTNGRADTWINPAGQLEVLRGAASVYRLLGAGDFHAEDLPADGELIGDALGYYLRAGGHSLLKQDWKIFLDFADKHLGPP